MFELCRLHLQKRIIDILIRQRTKTAVLRTQIHLYFLLLLLPVAVATGREPQVIYPPNCDSFIYCYGSLLHTVQMSGIHTDSKTFVDMKMKSPPNETMAIFNEMMNRTNNLPTKRDIKEFVQQNFDKEGSEFEAWEPMDWTHNPKFLSKISDPYLKSWASSLNLLWKFLGRKMKDDVGLNPEHYSIIYVPNSVIVPGGRFREFYYWDSYWIIKGLLLSEMYYTVHGMLENFLLIVQKYGFVPNGGRIYYTMRSQPPLLIPMVDAYVETTNDTDFIRKHISLLEREFDFWMKNHTVQIEKDGKHYTLARYKSACQGPRPESYREDLDAAEVFRDDDEKEEFYNELKTAAESGWDFSTRWFILNGTNKGNLTNLKTRSIVPVDLNAMIYWNARILSKYHRFLGNGELSNKYRTIADDWLEAVDQILWHEEVGVWLDYDLINDVKRDYFYPTNISPLWTGCYHSEKTDYYTSRVLKYLEKTQIMVNNQGGIPTSLEHSGEQWDYPNAWAPLQYIMIMSLDNTGDSWAQDLAFSIAERWTRSNFAAYNDTNTMFEKYDSSVPGGRGSGGEYELQMGFGWSNGIIMELLDKYSDRITHDDEFHIEQQILQAAAASISHINFIILLISSIFPAVLSNTLFSSVT